MHLLPQRRRLIAVVGSLILAAVVGCGGEPRGEVTGRITLQDGTPVAGALVIARSDETGKSANGQTDADGRFTLGVSKPGDGIPPGDYAVVVLEQRMSMDGGGKRTIDAKYGDYEKSGLTLSVADGETTVFDAKVDPL